MDMKAYDLIYRLQIALDALLHGNGGAEVTLGYIIKLIEEAREYLLTALPTEEEYRKVEENC